MFYHTGAPFSVINSRIPARLSASTGGTILADSITPFTATCGPSAVDTPCLSASQFATSTTQNNFGNQPRNSFRGPGYVDTDATLYKCFRLWSEDSRLHRRRDRAESLQSPELRRAELERGTRWIGTIDLNRQRAHQSLWFVPGFGCVWPRSGADRKDHFLGVASSETAKPRRGFRLAPF